MTRRTRTELRDFFINHATDNEAFSKDFIDSAELKTDANLETTQTDSYTITGNEEGIIRIKSDSATNLQLPAATGSGNIYAVFNAGTADVTPVVTGDDTINGTTASAITTMTLVCFIDAEEGNWDSNG